MPSRMSGFQRSLLKAEVVLGVALSLELLEQADITADATLTGESRDDRSTATPLRSGDSQLANGDLGIETLTVLMVGTQIRQQSTLDKRQLLQGNISPGTAQQWLDKREICQRRGEARTTTGELDHERVGESD